MRLVRKLLGRPGHAPRPLSYGEMRELGLQEGDVLRVARAAVHHPLAQLLDQERQDAADAGSAGDELSWLIGRALSLKHA
jgi:hypothetical protein